MNTGIVRLDAEDGSTAEISPHGAQVLAWHPAGEPESRLYLNPNARRDTSLPVRGGIPILFPQFGLFGDLPKHGLVRTQPWSTLPRQAQHEAVFELHDTAETYALWPHAFALQATITLAPRALTVSVSARNLGPSPFGFTAGLHTYLRVTDTTTATLSGLAGHRYLDALDNLAARDERDTLLPTRGPLDRVYLQACKPIRLDDGQRCLHIAQSGFEDVVVWNPGPNGVPADMPNGDQHRMVCVEAAQIARPITLAPGAGWHGSQTLTTG